MYKTRLTESEQDFVSEWAERRIAYCRRAGAKATVYNRAGKIIDPVENEKLAFGGEIAFCRIFNCFPDLGYDHFVTYDAIRNQRTIDVKTTDYSYGNLLVKCVDGKRLPDIYVLMFGNYPYYEYIGEAMSDEVFSDGTRVRRGDNEYILYRREMLHPYQKA